MEYIGGTYQHIYGQIRKILGLRKECIMGYIRNIYIYTCSPYIYTNVLSKIMFYLLQHGYTFRLLWGIVACMSMLGCLTLQVLPLYMEVSDNSVRLFGSPYKKGHSILGFLLGLLQRGLV